MTAADGSDMGSRPRSPWDFLPSSLWSALFLAAMFGGDAAKRSGLIGPPWSSAVVPLALCLLVPMLLAGRHEASEDRSAALSRYKVRVGVAVGFYIVTLAGAVWTANTLYGGAPPPSAPGWLLALLPTLPLLGLIWAMGRYLAEETDEYLRHLATMSALIGLAAVLVLASVLGMLELFNLGPRAWWFWLIPLFAMAQQTGRAWLKARGA